MEQIPEAKSARMLAIYARFQSGQFLSKRELVTRYGVNGYNYFTEKDQF